MECNSINNNLNSQIKYKKQTLIDEVINKYKNKLSLSYSVTEVDEFSKYSAQKTSFFNEQAKLNNDCRNTSQVNDEKNIYNNYSSSQIYGCYGQRQFNIKSNHKVQGQGQGQIQSQVNKIKNHVNKTNTYNFNYPSYKNNYSKESEYTDYNTNILNDIFKLSEKRMNYYEKSNHKLITLSLISYNNLNHDLKIKILSFLDSFELYNFSLACLEFKTFFVNHLLLLSKQVVHLFNSSYKRQLSCLKGYLTIRKVNDYKGKRLHSSVVLICEMSVVGKFVNSSVSIPFLTKFFSDIQAYSNIFRFDVYSDDIPLKYWVIREYTYVSIYCLIYIYLFLFTILFKFNTDDLNKAYTQDILPFRQTDLIELNINLLTDKGMLKRLKWSQLKIVKCPQLDYLNLSQEVDYTKICKNREVFDYNLSYFSEIEILKSKWIRIKGNLVDYDLILNKINFLFNPLFEVNEVWFDDIGYLVFKIYLTAMRKGVLHSSSELGIAIEVKDEKELISNEVKKNFLLFDYKNEIQVRVKDHLVFYLSKNK